MAYKRPESVLVVLYDEHCRVLVLQRQDDPNFWQSVTGTIELGEAPTQTAYREVHEETGIVLNADTCPAVDCQTTNVYDIRPQWRYRYPPGTTQNTEHVFCAQVDSQANIVLTEHLTYEWLTKPQAMNKVWSSTNREAIKLFVPEPLS